MRIGTGGSLLKRKPSQSDFSTPTKRYRDVDLSDFDDTPASSGRQRSSPMPESPTKEKGKGKAVLRMLDDSPTKSLRNDLQAFSLNEDAQLSTPRAARKPQNSFKKTHVPESRTSPQMDMNVDVSDYSDVETSTRRTCQRHPPPFLDRLFWSTRDPLVQREYDRGEAVYNKLVQVWIFIWFASCLRQRLRDLSPRDRESNVINWRVRVCLKWTTYHAGDPVVILLTTCLSPRLSFISGDLESQCDHYFWPFMLSLFSWDMLPH